MLLVIVIACAVIAEAGWLALWPLSVALTHSALFTTDILGNHPLVNATFALTYRALHRVLPDLPAAPLTDPLGSAAYAAPAVALAIVMLWLALAYMVAVIALHRGGGAFRVAGGIVLAGALAFQFTLAWLPGLFSQDVFSYIAYGHLAAMFDLNPYIWPPSVLREDPVVAWVAEVWRSYPSPYGPIWVSLQWALARVSSGVSVADQALVYRLLANVLLVLNLGLTWPLLGHLTPLSRAHRTASLAALAWNPLVLFEVAGGAHNDVLMVTFSLLALLLFGSSSRGFLSTAALSLGMLVKYLSGLGLVWLTLASLARQRSWLARLACIVAIGIVVLVLTLIAAAPWLEIPDSLQPLLTETSDVGYVNSLPDTLMLLGMARLGINTTLDANTGLGSPTVESARQVEHRVALLVFAVYLLWEARHVWISPNRVGVARALARSALLYVLVVAMSVQTWYFCLPISVAVALGWQRRLARLTLAYASLAVPVLYLSYYLRQNTPAWVFVAYALVPLAVFVPSLVRLVRSTTPPTATRTELDTPECGEPGRPLILSGDER